MPPGHGKKPSCNLQQPQNQSRTTRRTKPVANIEETFDCKFPPPDPHFKNPEYNSHNEALIPDIPNAYANYDSFYQLIKKSSPTLTDFQLHVNNRTRTAHIYSLQTHLRQALSNLSSTIGIPMTIKFHIIPEPVPTPTLPHEIITDGFPPLPTSSSADDGFTVVTHRKNRSRSPSPASSVTSEQSTTNIPPSRDQIYRVTITNIPNEYSNLKAFSNILQKIPGLQNATLNIYRNNTAEIKTLNPDLPKLTKQISAQIGSPLNFSNTRFPKQPTNPEPKPNSYSCVLTQADFSITSEDIQEHLTAQEINFRSVWRITSKRTNRPTTLFRIITPCTLALRRLLLHGLEMFNHTFKCEPSHPAKPQPIQCSKCLSFQHAVADCRQKAVCSRCGSTEHKIQDCESQPSCIHCKGPHPSYHFKCPERPAAPTSLATTAPVICLNPPTPPDNLEQVPTINDLTAFITTIFLNLFPTERRRIQEIISRTTNQLFNVTSTVSYSGNKFFNHILKI